MPPPQPRHTAGALKEGEYIVHHSSLSLFHFLHYLNITCQFFFFLQRDEYFLRAAAHTSYVLSLGTLYTGERLKHIWKCLARLAKALRCWAQRRGIESRPWRLHLDGGEMQKHLCSCVVVHAKEPQVDPEPSTTACFIIRTGSGT